MKRTRYVAGALLLAAYAAVGCSKTSDRSPSAASTDPGGVSPVVTTPSAPAKTTTISDTAVAMETAPPPPSFADGEAAYQAKKYAEALTIFEAYAERRPRNAWGHYMLALSAWKTGDVAKSEQAFEKALSIDTRHVKSYVNLSRVLLEQQRHADAIGRLTRAADVDPESIEVQRLLGRTYHALGQTDEAVAAYGRALELNERDAWSLNDLARIYLETGRADQALPLLIQAVEVRKDIAEFHNNLGLALEQTGHLRAAATAFDSALRVDPAFDPAKQNLARVGAR
jgi:tetratricopeptide (TPR) repeat protein